MKPQQEDLENCLDTLFLISLLGPEMVIDSGLKIHEMGKQNVPYSTKFVSKLAVFDAV